MMGSARSAQSSCPGQPALHPSYISSAGASRHDHSVVCRHDRSTACRRDHSAVCRYDRSAVRRHDRRMGVARDCSKKKEIAQRANPSSNAEFLTGSATRRMMGSARSAQSSCPGQPALHPSYIPAHVANGHDHSGTRREWARSSRRTSRAVTIIPPQASDDSAQRPDFSVLKTIQRYL